MQFDPAAFADLRAVSARIITAIFSAAVSKHCQAMVYVPSPFPINSHYIQLGLTMQRIDAIGVQGYYVRSLDEQDANIQKADSIVLSEHAGVFYPGGQMTPQLLNYLRADNALNRFVCAS